MTILQNLRQWARRIKRDGVTLWFACKDPATPLLPKVIAAFVVAYALSPIDLIPDFIPVLGYVDDVLLLPALIWLAIRLLPQRLLAECRVKTDDWMQRGEAKPRTAWGIVFVVAVWLAVAAGIWWWFRL